MNAARSFFGMGVLAPTALPVYGPRLGVNKNHRDSCVEVLSEVLRTARLFGRRHAIEGCENALAYLQSDRRVALSHLGGQAYAQADDYVTNSDGHLDFYFTDERGRQVR